MTAPFPLLPRQADALRYVAGYIEAHDGVAPTLGEIARALGIFGNGGVFRLLTGLEQRGAIRRLRRRVRAIEVLAPVAIPRAPDGAPLQFIRIGD